MHQLLSPEALLVLRSAGPAPEEDMARLLARPLNWAKVGWLVAREKVASVFWRRLRPILPVSAPPDVAEHLSRLAMVADFRMSRLQERVLALLTRLDGGDVTAVLLKGAAMAHRFHPSYRERPMGDVDILVPIEVLSEARAIAEDAGWRPGPFEHLQAFYAKHHHLAPMVDDQGVGVLELHTDLMAPGHPFAIRAEEVVAGASREPDGVLVPNTIDLLLHLCIHFAWSHTFRNGAWRTFYDLATLAQQGAIDWATLVPAARAARAATTCYWTFRLAAALARVPVPTEVLSALRPRGAEGLLRRLESHYAEQLLPTEARCTSLLLTRGLWRMGIQPTRSWHGRVRPWDRDREIHLAHLFPQDEPPPPPPRKGARWLARHGWYCTQLLFGKRRLSATL